MSDAPLDRITSKPNKPARLGTFRRRLITKIGRDFRRARKAAWQWHTLPSDSLTHPVFIIGAQRSGTTMVQEVLDRSPQTTAYYESDSSAMRDYRLRNLDTVDELIRTSRAKAAVFKPLTDSQWTDRLLLRFPNARALWVFRHYAAVAASAAAEWPGLHRRFIDAVVSGEPVEEAWQIERMSDDVRSAIKRVGAKLSDVEAAAMFWYARNQLYFDQELARDPRVLLVHYERLVTDPLAAFRKLFEFCGLKFQPAFADGVTQRPGRGVNPSSLMRNAVIRECESMVAALLAAAGAQHRE